MKTRPLYKIAYFKFITTIVILSSQKLLLVSIIGFLFLPTEWGILFNTSHSEGYAVVCQWVYR